MNGLLEQFLDRIEQEFFVIDSNGVIIWMNRYAQNTETMSEWLGQPLNCCLALEQEGQENYYRAPWGDRYVVEITAGEDMQSICYLENLTDFRNPKIQLQCYREIVDKLDVLGTNTEGRFVIGSQMAADYYGIPQQEMCKHYLSDFYDYFSEDQKEHKRVIETGKAIINQYVNRKETGKNFIYHPLLYSTYPFQYRGSNILAYTIMYDDRKLQSLLQEITELRRCMHLRDLQDEKNKEKNNTSYSFLNIMGKSQAIKNAVREAQIMAVLDQNVLIIGETGTGKEIFAQSIHNYGQRGKEPFIPINCAAIPENLLESILFGTVRGAYTGSVESAGLFQTAKHGTIFLDELNSMPIQMQTKLLRVLQERKAMRVGGHDMYPIDCRIISAMNEDPQILIQDGRLRNDLFYRIAPLSLYIPPLRERPEDILELSRYFVEKYNKLFYKDIKDLEPKTQALILSYTWPGNVRELDYVIENMMIRAQNPYLELTDLPQHLVHQFVPKNDASAEEIPSLENPNVILNGISIEDALDIYERRIIQSALQRAGGNKKRAAELLGISRQNLHYRQIRLNKRKENFTE